MHHAAVFFVPLFIALLLFAVVFLPLPTAECASGSSGGRTPEFSAFLQAAAVARRDIEAVDAAAENVGPSSVSIFILFYNFINFQI
jgi:hypothetical protein